MLGGNLYAMPLRNLRHGSFLNAGDIMERLFGLLVLATVALGGCGGGSGGGLSATNSFAGSYHGSYAGYNAGNAELSGAVALTVDTSGNVTAQVTQFFTGINFTGAGTVDGAGHFTITGNGTLTSPPGVTFVTAFVGTVSVHDGETIADGTFTTAQTGVGALSSSGKFTAMQDQTGNSPFSGTYDIHLVGSEELPGNTDGAFQFQVDNHGIVTGDVYDIGTGNGHGNATGKVTGTITRSGVVKVYGAGDGYTDTLVGTASGTEPNTAINGTFQIVNDGSGVQVSGTASGVQTPPGCGLTNRAANSKNPLSQKCAMNIDNVPSYVTLVVASGKSRLAVDITPHTVAGVLFRRAQWS